MENKTLAQRLEDLNEIEDTVLDLTLECMEAFGGAIYPMDMLANGASKRTLALCRGFRQMIEARNMICAGALLRLQIDTALRFYAAFLVEDPHKFAAEVLKGARIDKLKDRKGKRLQDFYLVQKLAKAEDIDWLERVYRETSGYVHFSGKHVHSVFNASDDEERTVEFRIGAEDNDIPEGVYIETVDAFAAATRLFMRYLRGWTATKQNPGLVDEVM